MTIQKDIAPEAWEDSMQPATSKMLDRVDFHTIEIGNDLDLHCSKAFAVGSTVFVGERGWYDDSTIFVSATPVGVTVDNLAGKETYLLYYGTLELPTVEQFYKAYGAFEVRKYHEHSQRIVLYPLFSEGREAIHNAMEEAGYGPHSVYAANQYDRLRGGADIAGLSEGWANLVALLDCHDEYQPRYLNPHAQ